MCGYSVHIATSGRSWNWSGAEVKLLQGAVVIYTDWAGFFVAVQYEASNPGMPALTQLPSLHPSTGAHLCTNVFFSSVILVKASGGSVVVPGATGM